FLRWNVRRDCQKAADFGQHDRLSTISRAACKQWLVDPNLRRQFTTGQRFFVSVREFFRGWSVVVDRADVRDVGVFPTIVIDHGPSGIESPRDAYHAFDERILSRVLAAQTGKAHALIHRHPRHDAWMVVVAPYGVLP